LYNGQLEENAVVGNQESIDLLIELLGSFERGRANLAKDILLKAQKFSLEPLIGRLETAESQQMILNILKTLNQINTPTAYSSISQLVTHKNVIVRSRVYSILIEKRDPNFMKDLSNRYENLQHLSEKRAVVESILTLHDVEITNKIVPKVILDLNSPKREIREYVISKLKKIHTDESFNALQSIQNDPDLKVQQLALKAILHHKKMRNL